MDQSANKLLIAGVMSGTSLDGLDIALCEFSYLDQKWQYKIFDAKTVPYSQAWFGHLANAMQMTGIGLTDLDQTYGKYIGSHVKKYLDGLGLDVDFISSHGHTVFHQPERGFTLQIGHGAHISAFTNFPVVSDFRTYDVALGGQGAPLVPIGDELLFSEYEYCLNLGGIANISANIDGKRLAFDLCVANQVLNFYANKAGKPYDAYGKMASFGRLNKKLFDELNALEYFTKPAPKSLGKEWFDMIMLPLCEQYDLSEEDMLCTCAHHIAFQIAKGIREMNKEKGENTPQILVTGGGAFNDFLMLQLRTYLGTDFKVVIPEALLVMFKEALIFAFLGLLRVNNQPNSLMLVTGASKDSIGGALHGDFSKLAEKLKSLN